MAREGTPRWFVAVPIAVALLAHGLGVGGEFVADDIPDLLQHPVVAGGHSLTQLFEYNFMGDRLGEGPNTLRPLATLSFALEWRLFGDNPALFHLLSIVWFAGLVLVAHRMLARLLGDVAALWAASLFASLAIHADAVGLIANRPEVSSLLFALLALGAALDGKTAKAVAFYIVALLFKESAFLLPLVAAWWLLSIEGRSSLRFSRRGKTVAALAAAAVAFFIARAALLSVDISGVILPADNPLIDASLSARLWMPFVLLGEYLQITAVPTDLAFDYTYNAISVDSNLLRLGGWIGLACAVSVLAIAFARFRGGATASKSLRATCVAAGGFAFSYALFSNSAFLIVTLFAERLFLAPSFFLVALIGCVGVRLVAKMREPRAILVVKLAAAAFIALQVLLTIARTGELRNDQTLFASQVRAQPDSVKGHLYYAKTLVRQRRFEEAVWHLGVASAGRGQFPKPFVAPRDNEKSLRALPRLLAPDTNPAQFWPAFRAFAVRSLGVEVGPTVDRAANAHRP